MDHSAPWWRKLPGIRLLREISIVVIGILIAFALDAWWEQQADAGRERAHMHALAGDFRQNIQRLDELIAMEERVAASAQELLHIAVNTSSASADFISRLFGTVFTSRRFEPAMGAYEGLRNSAVLARLRDDTLRSSLTDFAAQLDLRYYERFADEVFLTFIREFAGELRIFAPYAIGSADIPEVVYQSSRGLLNTSEFQEYLGLRHITARDVASEYRRLRQQAETVLDRLSRLVG